MLGIIASYVTINWDITSEELEKIIETYPPPHQLGEQALKNKNTPIHIIKKYTKKS